MPVSAVMSAAGPRVGSPRRGDPDRHAGTAAGWLVPLDGCGVFMSSCHLPVLTLRRREDAMGKHGTGGNEQDGSKDTDKQGSFEDPTKSDGNGTRGK